MSFVFESLVASRYLRSKRREGFISIIAGFSFLGIMLGVATLIIVMSVMNGFREELIGHILGLNGHINVYASGQPLSSYETVGNDLKKVNGVLSATPIIEGQALLTVNGAATGVMVRGLRPEDIASKPLLKEGIIQKLPDIFFGEDRILIGTNMAARLNVTLGDKIILISPQSKASPFGTIPRSRAFMIGGIFDVGMFEYNNAFIFMPLNMAQAFFQMGEGVSAIELMTPSPQMVDDVKQKIISETKGAYEVATWRSSNQSFYNALEVERNVMFLILTLIIIVAAFNIVSSLIMLVKDKSHDIAILRTMGATRGMIIRIFFYTGGSIGMTGTLAGLALGVAFAKNIEAIRQWLQSWTHKDLFSAEIYFLSKLPAKLDPHQVMMIALMSLGLSFIATFYPAWRAARLDPVEAFRHE